MELEASRRRGLFEVRVDGRKVLERKGGLIAKLTSRPWPTSDQVTEAVRSALGS